MCLFPVMLVILYIFLNQTFSLKGRHDFYSTRCMFGFLFNEEEINRVHCLLASNTFLVIEGFVG